MLLHKKSGALFEDTLIGDYYTLTGVNVQGTFRLSTDFIDDFEFMSDKQVPEVSKRMNKVEWNRALILYIGKDRQNQKKRKAELKQARLDRSQFRNISENVIIKGDIIRGLSLDYNVERIEKFDYERILPADIRLNKTPKAMEERFSPAQYGRVLSYGVIINTDYLYYQFENGVRVDLKKSRPESEEQFSLIQDKKGQDDKSIKSKDKKALAGSSGTQKKASGSKVFDMKYLEKELNLPPTKIRTLLRKHYEKPDGGWKWDSQEEINKVISKIKK